MNYVQDAVLDFPIGSVLIKNFYYPKDFNDPNSTRTILETRLLIHDAEGWIALPYVWNEEQTDAFLHLEGSAKAVDWVRYDGNARKIEYSIPNANQCKSSHILDGKVEPIGPSAKQLNRDNRSKNGEFKNQLWVFQEMKLLAGLPAYDQIPYIPLLENHEEALLDKRARGYWDINCAHCHRPGGPAKTSGLDLRYEAEENYNLGIMKRPVAAGSGTGDRHFDIVPGHPEESILLYRMETNKAGEMMPELGRSMVHQEGVELIAQWISKMNDSGEL